MSRIPHGASKLVVGTVTHSVGYLYLTGEGRGGGTLCKGLRHSVCNHFNGRCLLVKEVAAEWTNSAGLVRCGGGSSQSNKCDLAVQRLRMQNYTLTPEGGGDGSSVKGLVGINHSGIPCRFEITFFDFERLV